jgi:mitogen-activated protein kinase kinase kinase
VLAFSFSADQFQQMRSAVGNCMSLLIGNYGVLESEGTAAQHQYAAALQDAADSGARGRSRDRRARNQQTEAQTKQLLQERALDAIHALEERREIFLREQRLAGHPLDVATPEDASITSLASSVSNVSMHWRKGRFLGAGSAGSVHLAVDEDGGNVMAVKEITFTRANPQAMANLQTLFKQELDLLEMLHHPNIVTFYGIEVHRDKVWDLRAQ